MMKHLGAALWVSGVCVTVLAPAATRAASQATTPASGSADRDQGSTVGVRPAIVGGAGTAYGYAGAHLELRAGHWAGFLGAGLYPLIPAPALALGGKWFSGQGEGLVVSLHATNMPLPLLASTGPEAGDDSHFVGTTLGTTLGWRFRHANAFAEVGVGPALFWVTRVATGAGGGVHSSGPRWGIAGGGVPDFALALGWEY